MDTSRDDPSLTWKDEVWEWFSTSDWFVQNIQGYTPGCRENAVHTSAHAWDVECAQWRWPSLSRKLHQSLPALEVLKENLVVRSLELSALALCYTPRRINAFGRCCTATLIAYNVGTKISVVALQRPKALYSSRSIAVALTGTHLHPGRVRGPRSRSPRASSVRIRTPGMFGPQVLSDMVESLLIRLVRDRFVSVIRSTSILVRILSRSTKTAY